jgi:hypothetical protein
MFRVVVSAFTHPIAGVVGFGLALIMCGLLVATSISAGRTEASLRARLVQLANEDARTGAILNAKLSACESALPSSGRQATAAASGSVESRAQRLASRGPEGFDVCARMEAADRAVLQNLR